MKQSGLLLFFIFFSFQFLYGQNIVERERALFERGLSEYKNGNFQAAEQNFATVVSRLPNNTFLTANYLMLIKVQYKLQDYTASLNTAKRFIQKFPASNYLDDVYYMMGNNYFRLNRYVSAAENWLKSLKISDDEQLKLLLKNHLMGIAVTFLTENELEKVSKELNDSNAKVLAKLALVYKNDYRDRYRRELEQSLMLNSQSAFFNEASALLSTGRIASYDRIRIATLLPLSGPNKKIGEEIKEGIEFAVKKFNNQNKLKIEIVSKDYGADLSNVIMIIKELSADPSIVGIFGPIENDMAIVGSSLSAYEEIPIFTPTATANELTRLSDFFFQISNPIFISAHTIAEYAVDSLRIKRFATCAPIDNHFVQMVEAFKEKVEEKGSEVVSQQWYYPGEQDFYKQFMRIKRTSLKLTFSDSVKTADSLLSDLKIDTLYQEYVKEQLEEFLESNTKGSIDSADIPAYGIDGLYVPIYAEDFQILAPQIAYSNIQAQLLGNNDWYNPDELKKNKSYLDKIVFTTDGYLDENSWDYKNFRNLYRTEMQKTPGKYNFIGYDTFSFLIHSLANLKALPSRNEFIKLVQENSEYHGIYKKIELTEDRLNKNVHMLQYIYNQIIQIN